MHSHQREARLARVIKRRVLEARLAVASGAVLLEDTLVRVDVACRALVRFDADEARGLDVAGRAGHLRVFAQERKPRAVMVDLGRLPTLGRVAGDAGFPEALDVRALVTRLAGSKFQAPEDSC